MNPYDSGHYFLTRDHLRVFTQALAHALHDRTMEKQGREIRYYYDADIVVWMVLGLFGDIPRKPDAKEDLIRAQKEDLIRALLAAGFLGKAHILRPHALELHNRVSSYEKKIRSNRDEETFHQRILRYFGDEHILPLLANLDARLRQMENVDERVDVFVDEIKRSGTLIFIGYELARGNWQERLTRLTRKVLQFESYGEDIHKFVNESPEVWDLNRAIVGVREEEAKKKGRKGYPPRMATSDLSDAVALTMLSRLVREMKHGGPFEVRFHSNTPRLRNAALSEELRPLFEYPVQASLVTAHKWHAGIIFRSTEYYILRASFGALRFGGSERAEDVEPVTIADLERVVNELTDSLERHDDDRQLLAEVEKIRIGSESLFTCLLNIERTSFLARLLKEYDPPKFLNRLLTQNDVTDVFSASEASAAIEKLDDNARELAGVLTRDITGLREWLELTRMIREKAVAVKRKEKNLVFSDAIRDLGLVRWGIIPDSPDLAHAVDIATGLFSGENPAITAAAATLARETDRPTTESRTIANSALLWMLGLFTEVTRLIASYETLHKSLPLTLKILLKAARLRAKEKFGLPTSDRELSDLLGEVEGTSDPVLLGRYYIGLAYIAFYTAFAEQDNRIDLICDPQQERDSVVTEWASRSYQFALISIRLLRRDPLARAFAINHAAYLGVLYKIEPIRTARYVRILHGFRGVAKPSVWNYRFADTIGVAAYVTGYDAWVTLSGSVDRSSRAQQQEAACTHLSEAEEILKTARPYFGDMEIPRHLAHIQTLRSKIGCIRAARPK